MLVRIYTFDVIIQLTSSIVKMVIQKNTKIFGGVLKSMLTLNEAIIDVKEG